jgi:hypothetical protein
MLWQKNAQKFARFLAAPPARRLGAADDRRRVATFRVRWWEITISSFLQPLNPTSLLLIFHFLRAIVVSSALRNE